MVSNLVNNMPNPNNKSDHSEEEAQWVWQARGGDQEAFDLLVERYQRRAVAVSYRLLGNIHDASDVSQDAFLRAYRKLGKLEDPRRFGPWLMRIVTNLSLNYRRARSRHNAMSTEDLVENGEIRTPSGASQSGLNRPEAASNEQETKQLINQAIESLPEKQRLALTLFSIDGLPQKEVAEIMGCTVQLVKWNVFQARKALKEKLADLVN